MDSFQQKKETYFDIVESWKIFPQLLMSTGRDIPLWFSKRGVKGWSGLVVFFLSVGVSYQYRWQLQEFFVGSNDGFAESLARVGRYFGDGISVAVAVLVLFLMGIAWKKKTLAETSLVLAVAGLYCGVLTSLGQFILAEARPESGGELAFFKMGGHGISGHSSSSAVLFFPLYGVLGSKLNKRQQLMLGGGLLFWAGMVAWSRMWDNKHFLWNVMLGSSIGFFTGYIALRSWLNIKGNHSRPLIPPNFS